jgi:hypothetical protein
MPAGGAKGAARAGQYERLIAMIVLSLIAMYMLVLRW